MSGTEKKNGNGKEKMGNGKEYENGKKTWGTTKCQRQKESETGKERKEAKKNKMKSESPGNALFEARFAVASILPCFAALPSLPPSLPPSPSATKKSKPTSVLCSSPRPRCAVLCYGVPRRGATSTSGATCGPCLVLQERV